MNAQKFVDLEKGVKAARTDESVIKSAVAFAKRAGLKGRDRRESILSDLAFALNMFRDEVAEISAVKVALSQN